MLTGFEINWHSKIQMWLYIDFGAFIKVLVPLFKSFAFTQKKIDIYVLGYGSSQMGIGNLRTLAKKAV